MRWIRTLAEMRRNDIDLDIGPDETHARRLVAVDATQARAEVAVLQVRVRLRPFPRGVDLGEELVARRVVI